MDKKRWVLLGTIILGLMLLSTLGGCAGADIKVPNDASPAPLDTSYHNILMDATCAPGISAGQIACSLPYNEDLSKHSVTIFSPLGGSLDLVGHSCGVDKSIYLSQGEKHVIPLDELVPPQAEFCTISVFMRWQKPKALKTEVPFRGQSGKIYIRLRPYGTDPATMSWSPIETVPRESVGIIAGQFRGLAPSLVGPGRQDREPIMLRVKTTKSVKSGRYQLWSEAKKLGVKDSAYSGQEIMISREAILGTVASGGYTLPGWAIAAGDQMLSLDNDFVASIDVYRWDTKKLAAKAWFNGQKVCFEGETVIALAAMSGIDKAMNASSGCFERPSGEAILALFTNVGRASYALIQGETITWLQ